MSFFLPLRSERQTCVPFAGWLFSRPRARPFATYAFPISGYISALLARHIYWCTHQNLQRPIPNHARCPDRIRDTLLRRWGKILRWILRRQDGLCPIFRRPAEFRCNLPQSESPFPHLVPCIRFDQRCWGCSKHTRSRLRQFLQEDNHIIHYSMPIWKGLIG